jgi:hypothetical protein
MSTNSSTTTSVTQIKISETSSFADPNFWVVFWSYMGIGSVINLNIPSNSRRVAYEITSITDSGSYWTFGVSFIDDNGTSIPSGPFESCFVSFYTVGIQGSSGTGGSSGTSGTSGTSVAVGGTTNQVVKFTGSTAIGDSSISDDGTTITLGDITEVDVNTGTMDGQGSASLLNFSAITAVSKSFDIPHPTKEEPWRLQYGNLEGPEHGVYFRGVATNKEIQLPDYWTGLVDELSITVHLTPIGKSCVHYVEKIEDNKVFIDCPCGEIKTFFIVYAERKDVPKVWLEYYPKK